MLPKLTLITISYQACRQLEATIRSVAAQDCAELEYIVVDGGSDDGTVQMLAQYNHVVHAYVSEPDQGIYDALNKGLKMARGSLLGFLHAGDRFAHEQVLSRVLSSHETAPWDLLYGDLQYVTSHEPLRVLRLWKSGVFKTKSLRHGWMPPHPSVYFTRDLLEQIGNFDTSFRIAADYDWLLRALSVKDLRVNHLPEVMVNMQAGGVSNGSLRGLLQKSLEDYRALRKNRVGGWYSLLAKNLRKIGQFFQRSKAPLA
ncbi:glycosyltransferase family 2 protein [Geofilum rhodophaeum]|uniref:glycosyltransferase family 2 protein n=1 Tax=Geofilum rhodophaeum TaxID=1965019 RepID=UPI000B527B00|nr:glycosyltransferase family 2 protein [Geofilum rhodophaeum]